MNFPTEEVQHCPACHSHRQRQVALPDLSVCEQCCLYFRNPRPTQPVILHSYENGLTFHRWQQELPVRTFLWEKRLQLILNHVQAGDLLDIGTGDGFFLQFAKRHFDTQATETSSTGVAYAKSHGHDVHNGHFADYPERKRKFDVITLWHVLEHVPEPTALLKDIRRHLKPNGIVAIAVPNELGPLMQDRLLTRRSTSTEHHSFGSFTYGEEIHLTHFTPNVLKATLKRLGFKVLAFGVDDVHVNRSRYAVVKYHLNRVVNAVSKIHFDKAMYIVCRASK